MSGQGQLGLGQCTSRELGQSAGAAGLRGTTRPVTEEAARARTEKEMMLSMAVEGVEVAAKE